MAITVNPRELAMTVRELADFYQNYQAGRSPDARRPLAERFADRIPGELIPVLKGAYLDMVAMSAEWQQPAFQAALTDALVNRKLLAGFAPEVFVGWGMLLLALLDFLQIEQPGLGGATAKDFLLDDYIPMTAEQWVALNTPPPAPVEPPVEPEPEP